ncbi:MAG: sulfite oxidase [Chloroflexi bacterium]|nr:sulfite oxidase [Chloroflexota bacterium]
MSLYVVQHKHDAKVCPAGHPQMGPMLLRHISQSNASSFGIKVHGDAVLDGQHTFYLILEAGDNEKVKEFMSPFFQMGAVEIWPANSCERVVAQGHC